MGPVVFGNPAVQGMGLRACKVHTVLHLLELSPWPCHFLSFYGSDISAGICDIVFFCSFICHRAIHLLLPLVLMNIIPFLIHHSENKFIC